MKKKGAIKLLLAGLSEGIIKKKKKKEKKQKKKEKEEKKYIKKGECSRVAVVRYAIYTKPSEGIS